jgi:replicative DNA helicase
MESWDRLERSMDNHGGVSGLPSGIKSLDGLIGGFGDGHVVVIAGRPGMGKTTLGLNIAEHCALVEKKSALIFSLEMGGDELVTKLAGAQSNVNVRKMSRGFGSPEEKQQLVGGFNVIHDAPIYIDDNPTLRIEDIAAKSRRMHRKLSAGDAPLGVIVIDYLQLITGSGRSDRRERDVASMSREIKKLAKQLEVPILALSQLNRGSEKRGKKAKDKRPQLSDLRESGAIEQDADVVMFTFRPSMYDDDQSVVAGDDEAELIVRKNRHGSIGTAAAVFNGALGRFKDESEVRTVYV